MTATTTVEVEVAFYPPIQPCGAMVVADASICNRVHTHKPGIDILISLAQLKFIPIEKDEKWTKINTHHLVGGRWVHCHNSVTGVRGWKVELSSQSYNFRKIIKCQIGLCVIEMEHIFISEKGPSSIVSTGQESSSLGPNDFGQVDGGASIVWRRIKAPNERHRENFVKIGGIINRMSKWQDE